MRPLLVPGVHVLRRPGDQVQVGLDPERSLVLPGAVRTGLSAWAHGRGPAPGELLAALLRARLATGDDRPLRGALPPAHGGATWARHTVAALARDVEGDLEEVLGLRAATVVTVHPFGHELSHQLAEELVALCARAGLSLPRPRRPGPPPSRCRTERAVVALVGVGEPPRELSDPWLREGTAHLVVRLVEGRAVIGPFVVPGETACLRCIDAYLSEDDPAWPLLVEQYARASRSDRPDGIPEPVDTALAALAVAWAARDLASYAEGATPGTSSSTVRLGARLETIENRRWPRHPECGCGWG